MNSNNSQKTEELRPVVKWTLSAILALLVGAGVYFAYPAVSNLMSKNSDADLVGGLDNFIGWAPIAAMNDGLDANEGSRMTEEFGVKLGINVIGETDQLIAALKSGDVDFIFTTTDILPMLMEKGGKDAKGNTVAPSDLVVLEAQQFVALVDSRGGDVIVVDPSIKTVEQLRGKKVACALGWPSNTMLDYVLKAGGFTMDDLNVSEDGSVFTPTSPNKVNILGFASPTKAKEAYENGSVDAAVVWSPDNFACEEARPGTRELFTSADMPYTIVDVLVAKKSTLEKKKDAFMKLTKALLTANAEVQNNGKYEWAAKAYIKAFNSEDPINDIVEGLKSFRFMTEGDNVNFFSINPTYTGITGSDIYKKMARVYSNGYGNTILNVSPWTDVANTSIIEGIRGGMTDGIHGAEGQFTFKPMSVGEAKSLTPTFSRSMSVNFDVNSYTLSPGEQRAIKAFIGSTAKEFSTMRIRVEGNTDITGTHEENVKLSHKRAQAVVDFLVREYGFDRNRFTVVGNGPDKPIASNETEAGRAQNRRTDFEFLPSTN